MRTCGSRSFFLGLCLVTALASACEEPTRLPVPARDVPYDQQDAGTDAGKDAGADAAKSSSAGATGSAGGPSISVFKALDGGAQRVSESCNDFSTGAVHVVASTADSPVDVLMEITPSNSKRSLCGGVGLKEERVLHGQGLEKRIRQTDGKLFYLRLGNLYEFVADLDDDEDAGVRSPFDNDIKPDIKHKCGPNPIAARGPFSSFLFKPNGGLMYTCASDTGFVRYVHDDGTGDVITIPASIDEPIHAADDSGALFLGSTIRGGRIGIFDHGAAPSFTETGEGSECLNQSVLSAVRGLPKGFLLVFQNRCGVQLWNLEGTIMKVVAFYYHFVVDLATLADFPGRVELTADGVIYFSEFCTTIRDCFKCDGLICGIKPGARSTNYGAFSAYPPREGVPGNVPLLDVVLHETW